jgi:hypothetical protein
MNANRILATFIVIASALALAACDPTATSYTPPTEEGANTSPDFQSNSGAASVPAASPSGGTDQPSSSTPASVPNADPYGGGEGEEYEDEEEGDEEEDGEEYEEELDEDEEEEEEEEDEDEEEEDY